MNIIREAINYLLTLFILIIFYVSSLFLINFIIDSSDIYNNCISAYKLFEKEGTYPDITGKDNYYGQDNFTDSLMINVCYNLSSNINSIMNMSYLMFNDGSFNSIDDLSYIESKSNKNNNEWVMIDYARYWHGYVLFLKPLLSYFSYEKIRTILSAVILYLSGLFLLGTFKQLGLKGFFAFFAGLLFIDIQNMHISIQHTTVLIPTLAILLFIQTRSIEKAWINLGLYCFILGSVISFFDLLTIPIFSLGMFCLYTISLFNRKYNNVDLIKKELLAMLLWGMGYACTWASKWIISSIVLKRNVLLDAMSMSAYRVSGIPEGFSKLGWIKFTIMQQFIYAFWNNESKLSIVLAFLFMVITIAFLCRRKSTVNYTFILMNIVVSALPFIWYILLLNHSGIHAFFTWRNLGITVIGFLLIIFSITDFRYITDSKQGLH